MWLEITGVIKLDANRRLRLAAGLAQYDPRAADWKRIDSQVVEDLLTVPAEELNTWTDLLRPAGDRLLPALTFIAESDHRTDEERQRALKIIADYASAKPEILAFLVLETDVGSLGPLVEQLKQFGQRCLQLLDSEVARTNSSFGQHLPEARLARRRGNAALARLLLQGDSKTLWSCLHASQNAGNRSYLIHNLAALGVPGKSLSNQVLLESDPAIRQALLLILGEYSDASLPARDRAMLLPTFQTIYRQDNHPGVHAASGWLLKQWSAADWLKAEQLQWMSDKAAREERYHVVSRLQTKPGSPVERQWYVNGQGQTMVVIPGPVEFGMGSPPTENPRRDDEAWHTRHIGRSFALAATPVTRELFLRFMPELAQGESKRSPTPECPMGGVLWAEAAAYCNWLSKQEGIPEDQWCYEVVGEELKAKDNCLSLTGYRLPTEAEMEYATRAGTTTSRYFGESADYLPKYAWFEGNSQDRTWPVGSLKPNDFGFFDMLGNVYCWCHECYRPYLAPNENGVVDDDNLQPVTDITDRIVLRGGAYCNQSGTLRCATRFSALSNYRNDFFGLRPARTMGP
jgi:formylglycine-generating enzyme required for sulfatase activity